MSRRAAFTQADLERTLRALKAVGETVQGVEIMPDGSARVLTGDRVRLVAGAGKGGTGWEDFMSSAA